MQNSASQAVSIYTKPPVTSAPNSATGGQHVFEPHQRGSSHVFCRVGERQWPRCQLGCKGAVERARHRTDVEFCTGTRSRKNINVLSAGVLPIPRNRGRRRVRLLVKATKGVPLQGATLRWTARCRLKGDLRLSVDIDPQNFF